MRKQRHLLNIRGQSTVEYAVLISMVALAILVVQYYVRSAYTGRLRSSAEQLSSQWVDPTREYNLTSRSEGTREEITNSSGLQTSTITSVGGEVSTQTTNLGSKAESKGAGTVPAVALTDFGHSP